MKKKKTIEYFCVKCKIKTTDWEAHCETKGHIEEQKKSPYCKKIFDSNFISKAVLLFSAFPVQGFTAGGFKAIKKKDCTL